MHPGASQLAMELGCVLVSAMHQVSSYTWLQSLHTGLRTGYA